jgi:hypothetical protein
MTDLWYFAYGANMAEGLFVGRRGMTPTGREAGTLAGYRLAFDLPGIPLLEPAFANIYPALGEEVQGVLWRLNAEVLDRLDLQEGGGDVYARLAVTVVGRASGPVEAVVYRSARAPTQKRPSRRYLGLLLTGAREVGLDDAYIRWLETRPTHHIPGLSRASPSIMRAFDWWFTRRRR